MVGLTTNEITAFVAVVVLLALVMSVLNFIGQRQGVLKMPDKLTAFFGVVHHLRPPSGRIRRDLEVGRLEAQQIPHARPLRRDASA